MGLGYIRLTRPRPRVMRPAFRRSPRRIFGLGGASSQYTVTGDITMILAIETTVIAFAASVGGNVRPMQRGTGLRVR